MIIYCKQDDIPSSPSVIFQASTRRICHCTGSILWLRPLVISTMPSNHYPSWLHISTIPGNRSKPPKDSLWTVTVTVPEGLNHYKRPPHTYHDTRLKAIQHARALHLKDSKQYGDKSTTVRYRVYVEPVQHAHPDIRGQEFVNEFGFEGYIPNMPTNLYPIEQYPYFTWSKRTVKRLKTTSLITKWEHLVWRCIKPRNRKILTQHLPL